METTIVDSGSARHRLDGSVMVDRAWAGRLGAHRARGARRVGNFYRLPRVEYLRLIEATANGNGHSQPNVHPSLRWTSTDDLAVANMIEEAVQQESECVNC